MSSSALKAAATGQVAKSPVAKFADFMERLKPQMALALPKHMNADRMTRLALTAFSTTPALQECTPQSIAASVMTAAQLGLEPGIGGQCYLVPYPDRRKGVTICQLIPGWKGLVDLVARSGRATVWTGAVRAGDDFEYQLGDAPFCRHRPGDSDDGQPFTHVYAIGRVRDATMAVIEVWSRAKVQKHLKQFNKVGDRHYAHASENNLEMYARKVALLQVLKYMPASIELANAITVTNAAEDGRGVVIEGDFVHVQDQGPESTDPETGEISGGEGQAATQTASNAQKKPEAAAATPKAAGGPAPGPDDEWQPTPEELEAIRQRELAEAQGQQGQTATPAPAARRTRAAAPSVE